MGDRSTLVREPPLDPSKSAIENVLELRELAAIAPVRRSLAFISFSANILVRIYLQTLGPYGTLQEPEASMGVL